MWQSLDELIETPRLNLTPPYDPSTMHITLNNQ
jgi:hypothetical protein